MFILKAMVLICALAGAPAAAQAPPSADPMAGFYDATLSITAPYFAAKRQFAPDHTYRDTGDDGDVEGSWAIEDGKISRPAVKELHHKADEVLSGLMSCREAPDRGRAEAIGIARAEVQKLCLALAKESGGYE
jgi:hypothetical protein